MSTPADTIDMRELDRLHHLHAFTDSKAMQQDGGTRVITKAEGVYVWDSEGNRFLDGMAGLWCVSLGYGRKELIEAAQQQLSQLPYYNTFFNCSPEVTIRLAAKLAEQTPEGITQFFFCNSGSEANDSIIKLVRLYWNLMRQPRKKMFIARHYAYHGVTVATASISGLTDMHPQWDLPLPNFVSHVDAPYWYKHGGDLTPDEFGIQCARALENRILELGPETVAAFIGEPVYGAGGVMVPPPTYWPEVVRICQKYDVLLCADEVVCGFGRTGQWFGSQTFGIKPDFMTMGKGLSSGYMPISAVGVHERIAKVLREKAGEIVHGFTYSGHPVAAAVALRNLQIIEEENLVKRVREDIGPYFQQKLGGLLDHPLVGEVRGIGLLGAVEIVKDKRTRETWGPEIRAAFKVRGHCFANSIIMRAARDCLYASPPLVISKTEVDELLGTFRQCLDLTARDLGVSDFRKDA